MALTVGSRLGHYDVTTLIGEGGMGQVYQATDTKLNRQVALKILPEAFAADPDRLARFQREAQVLASLNHPGIAAIYGIEESDDTRALVLELVEGPTLADRIAHGPIPVDEALPIAKQIAEALEAAHEAGVIHRDLKPANIKVKDDGTVKVLDFGLAKAFQPDASNPDLSQSPTVTVSGTREGVILGTAAYMSPEQATGQPFDKRTDVWAFGVVVYEMLTGGPAFAGSNVSEVLANVIKSEPGWDAMPVDLSPLLQGFLRQCVAKAPQQRVHDIADMRLAIEGEFETGTLANDTLLAPTRRGWPRALPWVAGLALAVLTGLASWALRPPTARSASITEFFLTVPDGDTLAILAAGPTFTLSPDGQTIVYMASRNGVRQLFRREMNDVEPTPILGTEGGTVPEFSPDGDWVAFRMDGAIKKIALSGGSPITVYEPPPGELAASAPSWGDDDTIVFGLAGLGSGLHQVSASGGPAPAVTTLDVGAGETDHRGPEMLPGGGALLFTVWMTPGVVDGLNQAQIAVQNLVSGQRKPLIQGFFPRYMPTGHIVFARPDGLWAVPFDLDGLEVTGSALPVLPGVQMQQAGLSRFAVSRSGVLVYLPRGDEAESRLVWVDREGREEDVPIEGDFYNPTLSPDGSRIAGGAIGDLLIHDVARGTTNRLRSEGAVSRPLWTPDGESVVISMVQEDNSVDLFVRSADGTGTARRLTLDPDRGHYASFWSPDGQELWFDDCAFAQQMDACRVASLLISRNHEVSTRLDAGSDGVFAQVSPDGRWVAHVSDHTGQREVYLRPFPSLGDAMWPVSSGGGDEPRWGSNGELFYLDPNMLVAVSVQGDVAPLVGTPRSLFSLDPYDRDLGGWHYDVSPTDGRFLWTRRRAPSAAEQTPIVVLNWDQELLRQVPVD